MQIHTLLILHILNILFLFFFTPLPLWVFLCLVFFVFALLYIHGHKHSPPLTRNYMSFMILTIAETMLEHS